MSQTATNAFLDATEYANSMLLLLKNSLVMGRLVDGTFSNQVTDENGLTINIKRPPQFVAQDGEALQLQSVVNGSTEVKVDQYKNVHVDVGDLEYIQSYNDLVANETMKAAASELAHTIDGELHKILPQFASEVGTAGAVIASPQQFNKVHTQLMDQSVPNSDLNAVVTFNDGEEIRGNLIGTDIGGINRSALERVRIPLLSEINVFASNNTRTITAGTRSTTTGLIDDTAAGGSQNVNYRAVANTNQQSLFINGLVNASTISAGEIFTIDDVFAVNNRARTILANLRQFTVLPDTDGSETYTVDGTGEVVLQIFPPIIVPGTTDGEGTNPTLLNTAFQTVDSTPADGASITFSSAASAIIPIRAAFHKKAISLVSARLRTPFSDTSSFVSDPETGIGIRYWRGSDITTGKHIHRWDTVFGTQALQRELGARVNGS